MNQLFHNKAVPIWAQKHLQIQKDIKVLTTQFIAWSLIAICPFHYSATR